jgi:hypothetical protein
MAEGLFVSFLYFLFSSLSILQSLEEYRHRQLTKKEWEVNVPPHLG